MAETSLPQSLLTRLDDIERQLRDINQSAQTQYASIKDGTLTVLDAAGDTVIQIGKLTTGEYGISIYSSEGRKIYSVGQGITSAAPPGTVAMLPGTSAVTSGTSFRPGTASAAFTTLWTGMFFSIGPDVSWAATIFPNGGNMDFRVRIQEAGAGTPTNVFLDQNISANGNRSDNFTIPTACLIAGSGTDTVARFFILTFEAKRNSGASPVDIQPTRMPFNANFV